MGVFVGGCDGGGEVDSDTGEDTDEPVDTGTPPDPMTVELAGQCSLEEKYGGFLVEMYDEYSIVDGSVADGVVPITVLEEVGIDGDCTLLRRNNPFCDPPCDPNQTCDFGGTCIPYPLNQDIGTVTVRGLSQEVVMEPLQPGNSYFDTSLPHPAVEAGTLVSLSTTGGVFDPILLHGVGIEPLVILDDLWNVDPSVALTVNWSPPQADVVRSTVGLRFNIDQHGSTPVSIYCNFEDDGQAEIPASLLEQLMGFGVSGFPNGELTRRTLDKVVVADGCMELEVGSPRVATVRVDGFIPCDDPTDCPAGQDCNLEIGLCE